MLRFRHVTSSEAETTAWGHALARVLRPGDVVRLDADLGAGKTTLVRAVASGLGADPRLVSSPTYVIANEYPIPSGRLVHVDAYRLSADDEIDSIGLDQADESITIVEWARRIALPDPGAHIEIEITGETERAFDVALPNEWRARDAVEDLHADVVRCPSTNLVVAPGDPWYPFASERARMADLHGWMSGSYRVARPLGPDDDPGSLASAPDAP